MGVKSVSITTGFAERRFDLRFAFKMTVSTVGVVFFAVKCLLKIPPHGSPHCPKSLQNDFTLRAILKGFFFFFFPFMPEGTFVNETIQEEIVRVCRTNLSFSCLMLHFLMCVIE